MNFISNFRLPLVVCLVCSLSACKTLDLNFMGHKPLKKEDAHHPVREVICLWQPADGEDLNGLPGRGFAGQILFFASGYTESVVTSGEVCILVYDDQGSAEDMTKPIHEFKFPSEVWNLYSQESNFGAGYQVFIPYTRPGNHRAACSVRVKYTPGNGQPIYSQVASIVLPGSDDVQKLARVNPPKLQPTKEAAKNSDANVVQASHEQPATDTLTISGEAMARARQGSSQPDISRLSQLINASTGLPKTDGVVTADYEEATEVNESTDRFQLRRMTE